jgi:hypothetical protein
MKSAKIIKKLSAYLLLIPLLVTSSALFAQRIVESGDRSAGFRFATDDAVSQPVIHYQQNIQMLAGIDDRPTFKVYGSGRVLVHYPVYMKKAGDYEMQLDETELVALIQSLSSNGLMAFDEKKVKEKIKGRKKAAKAKGQFYEISDAVESVVEITLDEYQENKKSKKIKNFNKRIKWKNIEHDAARYKDEAEITKANSSILQFRTLMKDSRLAKIEQR